MMESSNEERQLNERDDNLHQLSDETTRENRVSTKREGCLDETRRNSSKANDFSGEGQSPSPVMMCRWCNGIYDSNEYPT